MVTLVGQPSQAVAVSVRAVMTRSRDFWRMKKGGPILPPRAHALHHPEVSEPASNSPLQLLSRMRIALS
jgi:hypothetical protein